MRCLYCGRFMKRTVLEGKQALVMDPLGLGERIEVNVAYSCSNTTVDHDWDEETEYR